jgi:hypothetical protein
MTLFLLQTFDRAGRILHDKPFEADDVYDALAHANRSLCKMVSGADRRRVDPNGHIDVADRNGRSVARVMCAEAIASIAPTRGWDDPRPAPPHCI